MKRNRYGLLSTPPPPHARDSGRGNSQELHLDRHSDAVPVTARQYTRGTKTRALFRVTTANSPSAKSVSEAERVLLYAFLALFTLVL